MKIIFLDLHYTNFLVKPLKQIIMRNKIKSFKHKFLLDFAIHNKIEIYDLIIDDAASGLKKSFRKLLKKYNALITIKLNGFKRGGIKIIDTENAIHKEDIVIAYSNYEEQLKYMKHLNCKKVVMGNHFIRIGNYSDIASLGANAYVNEINVAHNEFINRYYNLKNVKPLIMPYTFSTRFKILQPFHERKNLALAIGTLSTVEGIAGYEKYLEYAKTIWVQPMRKEIMDKKELLSEYIDSYISYIHEDKTFEIKDNEMFLLKLFKKNYNKIHEWKQSKYTSFNMVEKFNEYKMFICPEEFAGVPGIGFVEGMACGCAYIGLDHIMYQDLGLISGEHFITYDGTLEDLTAKIAYYQQHPKTLEKIAGQGYQFVLNHFNVEKVAKDFYEAISNL